MQDLILSGDRDKILNIYINSGITNFDYKPGMPIEVYHIDHDYQIRLLIGI